MTSRRQAKRTHKHTQIHTQQDSHTQHRLLIRPTGHAVPHFCMLGLDSCWLRFCMDQTAPYNIMTHTVRRSGYFKLVQVFKKENMC